MLFLSSSAGGSRGSNFIHEVSYKTPLFLAPFFWTSEFPRSSASFVPALKSTCGNSWPSILFPSRVELGSVKE